MKFGIRMLLIVTTIACGLVAMVRVHNENSALQERLQSLELAHGIPTKEDISTDVTYQLRAHPNLVTVTDAIYDEANDRFLVSVQFRDVDTGDYLKSAFSLAHESKGHYTGKFEDDRFFADVPEFERLWLSVIASPRLAQGKF